MDWFEDITGFTEVSWSETRKRLTVDADCVVNVATGARSAMGVFSTPSLRDLRVAVVDSSGGLKPRLKAVVGDVAHLHADPDNANALFQVASQFNMLEMVSPNVTPEHGVTRYKGDQTQGPACAMAAGAATIARNYLIPVDGDHGQTADRQIDGLADLGAALSRRTGMPVCDLWSMRNGYALASERGLAEIASTLRTADPEEIDALRGHIRFGLHRGVGVTIGKDRGATVSQIFCSALPVAYCDHDPGTWAPFARLVLESAYEATLLAGVINAAHTGSKKVFLTSLGGGAFGNNHRWILDGMKYGLQAVAKRDLDISIVCFSWLPGETKDFVRHSGFSEPTKP